VGSIYYLTYALGKGLEGEVGEAIAWITFITVVTSVLLHGTSATPLMSWYEEYTEQRRKRLLDSTNLRS
jgi:sodium/hydrogen antiporter